MPERPGTDPVQEWLDAHAGQTIQELIPRDRTDLSDDEPSIRPGRGYVRLRLVDAGLANAAGDGGWAPVVHGGLTLSFPGRGRVTFAGTLGPPGRGDLTGLVPLRSGTVAARVALLAVPGDDQRARLAARLLEELSGLVRPPLARAVAIAEAVSAVTRELAGAGDAEVRLVFQQEIGSGGGVRPGYIAVVRARPDELEPGRLRVVADRLHYGDGPVTAPLAGYDHLLLRVGGRLERDGWDLPDIEEPLRLAVELLEQGRRAEAAGWGTVALATASRSPDLVDHDRRRVVEAIREELAAIDEAGLGAVGQQVRTLPELMAARAMPVRRAAAQGRLTPEEVFGPQVAVERPPSGAAAPPPPPPAAPAATTATAHARLDCDDVAVASQEFRLQVGLAPVATAAVVTDGPMEVPAADYDLAVQVHADGFSLRDGESWHQEARVTGADRYPVFDLHLTPDPQEEPVRARSIRALYSANGQTVGMAVRSVAVVRTPELAATAEARPHEPTVVGTVPVAEDAPDLTVRIIQDDDNPRKLTWYLESPHLPAPDNPVVVHIGDDAKAFQRKLVDRLSAYLSRPGIELELKGIGRQLADLVDAPFWEALRAVAERVQRPPSVLLLSEEPYVPWELAVVDPPLDRLAPPFLGAQASVGRWVLGSRRPKLPPPTDQQIRTMAVVSGVFGGRAGWRRLPEAEEEARVLREDHGAGGIDATLPKVLAFIQGDPVVDLAHFAVHGKYDQTGAQDGLVLVDGEVLNPDQVRGADLAGSPFVFLNACQVGAGNQVLGQYGGMAAAFLYAGASAVIAPLWSVQDATARKLAVSFYQELAERRETRPAKVFREARGRFGQAVEEGSVSYLAYQFFGHPSMKLVRQGGS